MFSFVPSSRLARAALVAAVLIGPTLALPGCARLHDAWTAATATQVSPTGVKVSINLFNAAKATATNYLTLPRCNGTTSICRDPKATKVIIKAVRAGTVARDRLLEFAKTHPGQLGSQGVYDALRASIATLQDAYSKYNVRQ